MSTNNLDDIIYAAEERHQQSRAESEAKQRLRQLTWLSVQEALPLNDSATPPEQRRQYLVRLQPDERCPARRFEVAHFGHGQEDCWVTPDGRLLLPCYGTTVVGWCPLPTDLGADTCEPPAPPTPAPERGR